MALPALAAAKMILKGKTETGVIAPGCLDPKIFLREMGTIGWNVKYEEEINL